jgi:AcrR family transcriptional regulator
MNSAAPRLDRRHVRRAETIAQIVDVAVEVMGTNGVAGLSLGEVARRMGIRPPSLYVYFDSKNALYDAVFTQGWHGVSAAVEAVPPPDATTADLPAYLLEFGAGFLRWCVEHPVHAQLMVWRPVPDYEPSAAAYAPAILTYERCHGIFVRLVGIGLLRADVPVDEMFRVWTVLTSGVLTQQLANAPAESFADGTFTTLLSPLVEMFSTHYGVPPPPTASGRTKEAQKKTTQKTTTPKKTTQRSRRPHADQR